MSVARPTKLPPFFFFTANWERDGGGAVKFTNYGSRGRWQNILRLTVGSACAHCGTVCIRVYRDDSEG